MDKQFEQAYESLTECLQACNHCFDACLKEEDVNMMADCIRLDRECADLCALSMSAISRNSPFAKDILQLCVTACERCADECAKHDHDHCKQCAEACRKCAEACRTAAA